MSTPIVSDENFRALLQADPSIPRSYAQLKQLSQQLFGRKRRRPKLREAPPRPRRGCLHRSLETCMESHFSAFFAGLMNPRLRSDERDDLEADMDADTPVLENALETPHFLLRWTNESSYWADNIDDPAIVQGTADDLETAWERFEHRFGRPPYLASGTAKVEVLFHDIGPLGVTNPDGPIVLDSEAWVEEPGIRRPISAHELFHRVEYAFGYRTTWPGASSWFKEGMAMWAEVFLWQQVDRADRLYWLFEHPEMSVYGAGYDALPFWIFFEARQKSNALDKPLQSCLERYEAHGDDELALAEAIADLWPSNNVFRSVGSFYALFSRERLLGSAWKQGPMGAVYGDILDAFGAPIDTTEGIYSDTTVALLADVPLSRGDSYSLPSQDVDPLGAVYIRFSFDDSCDGRSFSVSVEGDAGGDFAFHLVWFEDGAFTRAIFPFSESEDYSTSQALELSDSNAVVLVVSGRDAGGTFSLSASVD